MEHKVVIYSGGADSYTLLHTILANPNYNNNSTNIHALSFDYGQRHVRELICARAECIKLGIHHVVISLREFTRHLHGSALTDKSVPMPEGVYDGENMRKTVVPGRNTLMLSAALAFAEGLILNDEADYAVFASPLAPIKASVSTATIFYGAHAGDHYIYPDCRPAYIDALARTMYLATDGKVTLKVPFQEINKTDILTKGLELGLDYENTWTCYAGGEKACGVCGSCDERLAGFIENKTVDPIPYASYGRWENEMSALRSLPGL